MIGIYKIINHINNKIYIGQSIDIDRRFKEHIRTSKLNKDNMPIHKAMYKYGIENFSIVVIEECEISLLDEKEKYYINCLIVQTNVLVIIQLQEVIQVQLILVYVMPKQF